ncbi:MAG: protein kinase [Clostridium sp.]
MKKTHCYSVTLDEKTEILFRHGELLGEGNNGVVYRLPGDLLIKIFYEDKVYLGEAEILQKVRGSKYFPRIKWIGDRYIIREMVFGKQLDKYIKENGLSKELTLNLMKMLDEFKRLGFTKLDMRCKDLYVVNEKEEIMLIDPKGCYKRRVNFPRHLMKGLKRIGYLNQFLNYIDEFDKEKRMNWETNLERYLNKCEK